MERGRRLIAWCGAAALGLLAAAPAQAAPGPELYFHDVVVGFGTDGATKPVWVNTTQAELADVVVSVETSGVQGVATVRPDTGSTGCETTASLVRCSRAYLDPFRPVVSLAIAPVAQATSGDSGTIRISLTARGVATQSITRKVSVGDVVDLAAEPAERDVSGKPGGTIALPGGVRNLSSKATDGVILWGSSGSDNVTYARKGANCIYTDKLVACQFKQTIKAGTRYDLAAPITLNVRRDAPAPIGFDSGYFFDTLDDGASWFDSVRRAGGKPGSGPALTLAEQPNRANARGQTDVNQLNNDIEFHARITGDNAADQIAVGGTFRGTVGSTVKATLGLRNGGPARVDVDRVENPGAMSVRIVVPSNATAVAVSNACAPVMGNGLPDHHQPAVGARELICFGSQELEVGATTSWQFSFRINAASGTAGSIAVQKDSACCHADDPNGWAVLDRDPSNNTAAIVVAPPTGVGGTDGADGTGGTGGGELAITGTATATYAAAGAGLAILGAVSFALARRRRTRFTV